MDERTITLRGVAQARRSAARLSTRLIRFPDGVTRHITLPGWQWAVFDRLDRNRFFYKADVAALAFQHATDGDPGAPFEDALRFQLSMILGQGVSYCSDYLQPIANDC